MELSFVAAQFEISLSIKENLDSILELLDQTKPGDLVVFPEGSVSGYSTDMSFLDQVNQNEVNEGLDLLQREAIKREINLWVGACLKENGDWINTAVGFSPQNKRFVYQKINLANHERGTFSAGSELPLFQIKTGNRTVLLGIQICREIRYPEQWGWLARCGAKVILHLNNAVGDESILPVWRSHLVSRAAETQRFVISANNAAPDQKSPTIIVKPDGQILREVVSDQTATLRAELDLSLVSDWNLDQCRTDVIQVKPPDKH
jgi:predicted amidohydrolase